MGGGLFTRHVAACNAGNCQTSGPKAIRQLAGKQSTSTVNCSADPHPEAVQGQIQAADWGTNRIEESEQNEPSLGGCEAVGTQLTDRGAKHAKQSAWSGSSPHQVWPASCTGPCLTGFTLLSLISNIKLQ